ncbi:hypothetical protein JCM6882_002132 [Rhodosporidiobolus microsporus]
MDTAHPIPVLVSLFHPFPRTLSLSLPSTTPLSHLPALLSSYCPPSLQSLSYASGRSLPRAPALPVSALAGAPKEEGGFVTLRLGVRVRGGKGGFASQLRAQGGRMSSNKAQNTDSCRGLDGRRLSTIKEAQKMAKLLESEPDRLAAAALQKQQKLDELNAEIARLERAAGVDPSTSTSTSVAAGPSGSGSGKAEGKVQGGGSGGVKRRLDDQKYVEESRAINSGVKDAVRAAMLKKRKKTKPSPPAADENAAPATAAVADKVVDVKGKGKAKAKAVAEEEEKEGDAEEAA